MEPELVGLEGREWWKCSKQERCREDQQEETSQTSVHAQKPEKEGGIQEWKHKAKLEVGVMGTAGREQGRAVQSCSGEGGPRGSPEQQQALL